LNVFSAAALQNTALLDSIVRLPLLRLLPDFRVRFEAFVRHAELGRRYKKLTTLSVKCGLMGGHGNFFDVSALGAWFTA
jgi:hypothetical protein